LTSTTSAATPTLTVSEFWEQVREDEVDAFKADGYLSDGETEVSSAAKDAVARKIDEVMADRAIVASQQEKDHKSVLQTDLAALAFSNTAFPGSAAWESDVDGVNIQVVKNLRTVAGKLLDTGPKGKVAGLAKKRGYVLCSAKIHVGREHSFFYTKEKAIILADYVTPRQGKMSNATEKFATDLGHVVTVVPSMKKAVEDRLETGLKNAQIAAKAKLAEITAGAGSDDDDDA
jgi:hypothetical protein